MDVRRALQDLAPRERACIMLPLSDDLTVPQEICRLTWHRRGTALLADAAGHLDRHR